MKLGRRSGIIGIIVILLIGVSSLPLSYSSPQLSMTIGTDKPVYLPSELVVISGSVEENGVAKANTLISIEVRDQSNTLVYSDVLYTSEDGSYSSSFKLPSDADGNYTVYGMIEGLGAPVEASFSVGDLIPPTLTILAPVNGSVTNESTISVCGLVSDNVEVKSVLVNGSVVEVVEGGFSANVSLVEGWNLIVVSAYDTSDNLNEKSLSVEYTPVPVVPVENVTISREETKLLSPITGKEKTTFKVGEGNIIHIVLSNPTSELKVVVLSIVITHEGEVVPPSTQFKLSMPQNSTVEAELEFATMEPGTYKIGISVLTNYVRLEGVTIDTMSEGIEVVG